MTWRNHKHLIMGGGVFLALIVLGAFGYFAFEDRQAWQHTLENFLIRARGTPWALPLVCLVYIAGGAVFFPVMVMNLACAVVFGLWGILYSLIGAMLAATAFFGVGRLLHKKHMHLLLKHPKIGKLDRGFNHAGIAGIVTLHTVPVPPFTAVNLGAGLSSIHFPVYIIGTFIALLPGAIVRGVVGDSLSRLFLHPDTQTWLYLGTGVLLWVGLIAGTHMGVRKSQHSFGR